MYSAFGVDHGGISKGVVRGPGGLPRSRKLIWVGSKARKGYEGGKRAGHAITTAEISVQGLGRAAGRGSEATGRGAGKLGGFLEKHPAVTGTTVVGTGAGVAGYQYNKARTSKPKVKASKPSTSAPEAM